MIILNFNLSIAQSTTTTAMYFDNIALVDGFNLVSAWELGILQKHPDYLRLRELGAFGIQEV